MTKTKKRNIILTLAALLFAAFSALLFLAPKQAKADETATIPVLSETEASEKLSEPQDNQMLKGKYLLIAADVETVHFVWGNLSKGDGVFAFSWYIDGTAGDKNIEYTTIMYNGAEYEYLLFDDNAGYEAFTYHTNNNEGKTVYISDTELLFDEYGKPVEEKQPFDLGDWLKNAGNDVSAWLGDNVGISITGGTVLIIGAVIIFLVFRRRRR